ncbi:hypothetical protein EJ110_NYTH13528 [Nymphaea thermarum]|nr:hypothetical protein EJ110_NYTH13528 [Nymphaea thermarum]
MSTGCWRGWEGSISFTMSRADLFSPRGAEGTGNILSIAVFDVSISLACWSDAARATDEVWVLQQSLVAVQDIDRNAGNIKVICNNGFFISCCCKCLRDDSSQQFLRGDASRLCNNLVFIRDDPAPEVFHLLKRGDGTTICKVAGGQYIVPTIFERTGFRPHHSAFGLKKKELGEDEGRRDSLHSSLIASFMTVKCIKYSGDGMDLLILVINHRHRDGSNTSALRDQLRPCFKQLGQAMF